MQRKCPKCFSNYEGKVLFCPECKCMTKPFTDSTSLQRPVKKKNKYDDWEPPSPASLYIKIYKIGYDEFSRKKREILHSEKYKLMISDINSHRLNCKICKHYYEGFCSKKEMDATKDSICKGFEP